MVVDSPSSGAMKPSDGAARPLDAAAPQREPGSALRNMGLPTVGTIDEADSLIPAFLGNSVGPERERGRDVSWLAATLSPPWPHLTDGRHEAFVVNGEGSRYPTTPM